MILSTLKCPHCGEVLGSQIEECWVKPPLALTECLERCPEIKAVVEWAVSEFSSGLLAKHANVVAALNDLGKKGVTAQNEQD
jgi:hypothetical protein